MVPRMTPDATREVQFDPPLAASGAASGLGSPEEGRSELAKSPLGWPTGNFGRIMQQTDANRSHPLTSPRRELGRTLRMIGRQNAKFYSVNNFAFTKLV
jgi:hypothetical protein